MTTAAGFLSAVTVIGNATSRQTATMPVAGEYVCSWRIGHAAAHADSPSRQVQCEWAQLEPLTPSPTHEWSIHHTTAATMVATRVMPRTKMTA